MEISLGQVLYYYSITVTIPLFTGGKYAELFGCMDNVVKPKGTADVGELKGHF